MRVDDYVGETLALEASQLALFVEDLQMPESEPDSKVISTCVQGITLSYPLIPLFCVSSVLPLSE
jgi:hypothetical protein